MPEIAEYLDEYIFLTYQSEEKMTDLVTKKETSPTEIIETPWGAEGAAREDMLIPRVLLMQAMSKFVADGKAAPGDIVDSVNIETLAKLNGGVEIIPIMTFKEWRKYKVVNGESEYLGKEAWGPHNATLEHEVVKDGITYRNDMVLNFFVLLANRIHELPHLVSFSKSSYHAGKKLSTHFQISGMRKLPPALQTFNLTSQKTTYDKYTYFIYDVAKKRETKKEELEVAHDWWKTLTKSHVKVDETEDSSF